MIPTTKLTNGLEVLAHESGRYAGSAKTYANRTQANAAAARLNGAGQDAQVYNRSGSVFYVAVTR